MAWQPLPDSTWSAVVLPCLVPVVEELMVEEVLELEEVEEGVTVVVVAVVEPEQLVEVELWQGLGQRPTELVEVEVEVMVGIELVTLDSWFVVVEQLELLWFLLGSTVEAELIVRQPPEEIEELVRLTWLWFELQSFESFLPRSEWWSVERRR